MADRDVAQRFTKNTEANLWAKIDKKGPDECWHWTAFKNDQGYGKLSVGNRPVKATHLVLIFTGSPRPEYPNNCALHSCDTPSCCNPAHLRWGSKSENYWEAVDRGLLIQNKKSEKMGRLTAENVAGIKLSDKSAATLSRELNIPYMTVYNVKRGCNWAYIK